MPDPKTKSESATETSTPVKSESKLRVFNFTRDNFVVKAKNRKEAELALKAHLKESKEDK